MSDENNPTYPAFPCKVNDNFPGLSKREYFAAMAMQGLLASDTTQSKDADIIAGWAVQQADAMLKRLDE